jgi:hypothetical protein
MAFVTTNQLVQIVMNGFSFPSHGSAPKKFYNSWCYYAPPIYSYNVADRFTLGTTWRGIFFPLMLNALASTYFSVDFDVWFVNVPGDVLTPVSFGFTSVTLGPRLPHQQAICISTGSTTRGRQGRGSHFWGPVHEAYVTGDELNAAGIAAWNPIAAAYLTPFFYFGVSGVAQFFPCIWSRAASPVPPPAAQVISPMTTSGLSKTITTWRHRRERTNR